MPPGAEFLLGTTNLGRDIYSQLVYGTRSALAVGLTAAVIVATVGTIVGLVAGYFGGWIDAVLMRLADIALGIPFLPFVIVLAGFLGASTCNVVLAVALLLWPNTARVIRSQVLTAARARLSSRRRASPAPATWRILFVHIAPNILPLTLPLRLDRHRLGDPHRGERQLPRLRRSDSVSWGYMLQDAFASQALSRGQYNWFVPPGICIILVVVAGFFISRGYEEILFPRLRGLTGPSSRSTTCRSTTARATARRAPSTARTLRRARGPHRRPGGRIGCGKTTVGARHHRRAWPSNAPAWPAAESSSRARTMRR